jgi:Ser-tRNA(Ala) deacylase AlaX
MMTELLYMDDCYLKEFDAKVVVVNGILVELDRTAFYPLGGGVASDTGKLIFSGEEFSVKSVVKMSGRPMHEIGENGLKPGDAVHGVIDWNRRHKLMRMHTAAHLLSGVFYHEGGILITGNQIDVEQSRMDFNLENFDKEKIMQFAQKANELIQKDLAIKIYYMQRDEALKDPGMVKLAEVLPPNVPNLRIVEIVNFDRQPDGGCHVKSLMEIGEIEIIKLENKGKNNRRLYYKLKDK